MSGQTRREFLRKAGTLAASVGTLSVLPGCASADQIAGKKSKLPNVVLIMTEDQGWGDMRL